MGFFSSEVGPSALYGAYQLIKRREQAEVARTQILLELKEKFGENNPEVGTLVR